MLLPSPIEESEQHEFAARNVDFYDVLHFVTSFLPVLCRDRLPAGLHVRQGTGPNNPALVVADGVVHDGHILPVE